MGNNITKILGLVICTALTLWVIDMAAGIPAFIESISSLLVVLGAVGFALAKDDTTNLIANLGAGAVCFGWLGLLVGVVGWRHRYCGK